MTDMPANGRLESTLPLLRDPYRFLSREAERLGSRAFRARLRLEDSVCLTGAEAAELFYQPGLFRRRDAAPGRLSKVLFGKGGVQMLDGDAHRRRKALFLQLLAGGEAQRLGEVAEALLDARAPAWAARGRLELFEAATALLTEAGCAWAGVPLPQGDVERRRAEMTAMVTGAGAVGPRYIRGRLGRIAGERWARRLIRDVRRGRLVPPEGRALAAIAGHSAEDGPLPEKIAAVELLNVIRPIVAVGAYVVFLADALARHPGLRPRVAEDAPFRHAFVQEVRRLAPFFPLLSARATRDIACGTGRIAEGQQVLLDLYGTNRDPRRWEAPEAFRPERFRAWQGDPFAMVPQGGGEHASGHRCPGEWATIALMERFAETLTRRLDWRAEPPPLDMAALPALPKGGFWLENLRLRPQAS